MAILNYGGIVEQGLSSLGNQLMQAQGQREAREARKAQQDSAQADEKSLTGLADLYKNNASTQELYQYGLDNPAAFDRVSKTIGFKSDQTKQLMQDTLISALQNPEQRDQIIAQGSEAIKAAGGNPQYLSQAIGDDTEGFERGAVPFLASLGGQGADFAKTYMDIKPQAAESMTEAQSEANQRAIERNDLAKRQLEQKTLENQYRRETDELKRKELEQKIEQAKVKSNEAKQQDQVRINDAISSATEKKASIDELVSNADYMDSISGFANYSKVPEAARTTNQNEAAAYLENIKNSMTLGNLGVMSGPLTDTDIKIIASASSKLRPGMSEKVLKKELTKIQNAYDRVISNYQKEANRKGYEQPTAELSDEDLVSKYL